MKTAERLPPLPPRPDNPPDFYRYSRNTRLAEIGPEGPRQLLASRVLVVGAGGLGAPAIIYLAAAGVGEIVIADPDVVELSNLQRQVIFRESDVGRPKTEAAAGSVSRLNSDCRVVCHPGRLTTAPDVVRLLEGVSVALDCSDNFDTRFLVSDICWMTGTPLVAAAAIMFSGQLSVIDPRRPTPCYRCTLPEMPPPEITQRCATAGVLGAVTGVMGAMQALEAVKLIAGIPSELLDHILNFDALAGRFVTMRRASDPDCVLCHGAGAGSHT